MTDNKASAMLFDTPDEAKEYCVKWKITSQVSDASSADVELVEVEVKPTISKVGKVVEIL